MNAKFVGHVVEKHQFRFDIHLLKELLRGSVRNTLLQRSLDFIASKNTAQHPYNRRHIINTTA
ncbi:hypothetical protein ACQWG0_24935, partial [Salmonella enterica subsp. enterica serovar Infantis]